jgi:hypothetical protein
VKKRLVLILGCLAAGMTQADITGPDWETTDAGAVHVAWTNWTSFNSESSYGSDVYTAYDPNGIANDPDSALTDPADAYSKGSTWRIGGTGADGIQIEANWDFSIWVPTYADLDVQQVYLQITYWDDINDADWRQGWDLGLEAVGTGSTIAGPAVLEGEDHDLIEGLITEAYSFTITGASADGFFVDFNADPGLGVTNPGQIYSITADSLSYAVPEPMTMVGMLIGGVILVIRKRLEGVLVLNR